MGELPEGRIYQVWNRQNGIGALLQRGHLTRHGRSLIEQVEAIIARGYTRVGLICHKKMMEHFKHLPIEIGNFYGQRGTNRFRGCDCLIVAGTPMPPLEQIEDMAVMLFQDRNEPFRINGTLPWVEEDRPYNYIDPNTGGSYAYPTPGFWGEPDLQLILEEFRESEILQSAHRARPLIELVDIWLLTNIPTKLEISDLITTYDVLGIPPGVHQAKWERFQQLADERYDAAQPIRSAELVTLLQIDAHTSRKYIDLLANYQSERWNAATIAVPGKRGKPALCLVPLYFDLQELVREYFEGD